MQHAAPLQRQLRSSGHHSLRDAGPRGHALAPPAYGLDFVDRGLPAASRDGLSGLARVPAPVPAPVGEKQSTTEAGALLVSYDKPTDKDEVTQTIRKLVKEDADSGKTRVIYVISGTHGNDDGTVTQANADMAFKDEDLATARIIRGNINVRDFHQTATNRWRELSGKGPNVVIILAWCYSHKWTTNDTDSGNHGKIAMR